MAACKTSNTGIATALHCRRRYGNSATTTKKFTITWSMVDKAYPYFRNMRGSKICGIILLIELFCVCCSFQRLLQFSQFCAYRCAVFLSSPFRKGTPKCQWRIQKSAGALMDVIYCSGGEVMYYLLQHQLTCGARGKYF